MSKNIGVIICAAGRSNRFGGKRKKPFVDVAGRPAFIRSVEFFANRNDVKQILLAIPPDEQEMMDVKWGPNLKFFNVKVYHGGAERFETVRAGLKLIKEDIDLVAVHDAVRCCLIDKWIEQVFAAAARTGAAILAAPVTDTIKQVENKTIIKTVDRGGLYEAQTPQVFEKNLLRQAYENLEKLDKSKISDDSHLVEALGRKVSIVEADSSNIKITRPEDIAIAEAIIKSRPRPKPEGPLGPYIEAQW
jgi:2-C-methyl-D-erythritol 4-phosphate cytidylyltransferase